MIKKFVLVLLSVIFTASPSLCSNTKSGGVEFHDYLFDYSKYNTAELKNEAGNYIKNAIKEQDKNTQKKLLHAALKDYYIILKISPKDIHSLNRTAYIYDLEDRNLLAKSYFAQSMNLDENNPETNYLVGDYFFKRRDFKRGLRYFTKAYENGYNTYDINYKLGTIYEKLGDLCNAKKFYERAYEKDNSKSFLAEKIRNMPEENPEYHGKGRK